MRTWLPIFVILGIFAGVYTWRKASVQTPIKTRPPFPGAQLPGELQPGSPVTAKFVRGGLLVDGDVADPLQNIELYRLGTPEEKIVFSGGWTSPVRAIWFFEADPAAKYRVEIRTRHRSMAEVLQRGAIEPLELQRVRMHVKTAPGFGTPVLANFSPDGAWLAVASNNGDMKLVSTPGDQTRLDLHTLGKVTALLFTPDSKVICVVADGLPNGAQAYEIATGKESPEKVATPKSSGPIQLDVLASSGDGRWMVKAGAASGSMALFDARSKSGPTKPIYSIPHPFAALSNDGKYLAAIDERNLAAEPEEADVDVIVMH